MISRRRNCKETGGKKKWYTANFRTYSYLPWVWRALRPPVIDGNDAQIDMKQLLKWLLMPWSMASTIMIPHGAHDGNSENRDGGGFEPVSQGSFIWPLNSGL